MRRTLLAWLAPPLLLCGFALPPAYGDGTPPPRMTVAPSPAASQAKPPENSHMVAVPYAVALLSVIGVLVVVCMPSRKHA